MTRIQFCKEIAARSGVPRATVEAVIAEEENLVYEIMATCDFIKYIWGTISGEEKHPRRVGGKYREIQAVRENGGWSNWKIGYPTVKWTRAAKVCDIRKPKEYFEQFDKRYTTKARLFRKEAELPEIPEFEGLSEEKIMEICKKADEVELNSLTKGERTNRERDTKFNLMKKRAMIDYWKKIGYIPQGVVYDYELGDENYDGKQYDTVTWMLEFKVKPAETLQDKLEQLLITIDVAEYKKEIKDHPELFTMEAELRKEMAEKGIEPLKHEKRYYNKKGFRLRFQGEENPWNFNPTQLWENTWEKRDYRRLMQMEQIRRELDKDAVDDKNSEDVSKESKEDIENNKKEN